MKKTKKENYKIYRKILICINSPYSYKNYKVVVMFPDIEVYFKNTAGVKAAIDAFLYRYKIEENNIPF